MATFLEGLLLVLQWPNVGLLALGALVGVWLGAVPGLSGIVGMVIALPFTFGMDPVSAFVLLLSLYAVTTTGDTLSAVLLGVPGTAASAATILDGFPMAQRGEAERALGAAFAVSMVGGVIGGLLLALSLPVIRPVIVQFASPEFFMLGALGLTMVGALSGTSMLKGLVAAGIGLLISMVGYPPASPIPRYWFDQTFLLEGLPMVAVVLGLFAVPEVMELSIRSRSISKIPRDQAAAGGLRQGIRDAVSNWFLVIRCSAIGIYIGMLPGLGASVVDWIAYGHTVQSAKDKSRFGKGDVRGVIGPEAANNAVRGGALIPTIAFGIPGSASMAVLLGALLIHGLTPGKQMLSERLDLTYSMVWTIILANILAAVALMMASRQIARLAFLPGHYIVPGVIVLVLMGAWSEMASLGVWGVLLGASIVGFWMKQAGWPRPPLLLGFILGPIMESGYRLSTQAFGQFAWMGRPWVIVFTALIVLTLVLQVRRQVLTRRATLQAEAGNLNLSAGEGTGGNVLLSMMFSLGVAALFAAAAYMATDWRASARAFPLAIAVPAFVLVVLVVLGEWPRMRAYLQDEGGIARALGATAEGAGGLRAALAFGSLLMALVGSWLIGQPLALTLYAGLFVFAWGRTGPLPAILYAAGIFALLYGFYGQLLSTSWLRPVVSLFG